MDGSEEVYRVTFSFYIFEKTTEDWERHMKFVGGFQIAFSLISLILAIIGLVGVLKRKSILVHSLVYGGACYIGVWTANILFYFAIYSDDFTISPGLAWTLTIALVIATVFLFYFPYCVLSLALKLHKKKKEEKVSHKPFL